MTQAIFGVKREITHLTGEAVVVDVSGPILPDRTHRVS